MFGGGWKEGAEFFILFIPSGCFFWLLLTRTGAVWVCQDCLALSAVGMRTGRRISGKVPFK